MPRHVTRMLLLGAVALFEPVNGYQIRRELVSWRVDTWAHVNPGSIYTGLTTLTRQGHLARHDLVDNGREVAVYELTAAGRGELRRLHLEALEEVDLHDRAAFTAAFSMLPLIDATDGLPALERRAATLATMVEELSEAVAATAPPHAMRNRALWRDLAATELAWLRSALQDIADGVLAYGAGPRAWVPPPDDPGWQMSADRERYLRLLGR